MMHWGDYGWGMGFGWIFMIIFWLLVILGVVFLFQTLTRDSAKTGREDSLEILKKRYAKGEISKEEFERMKDDLKKE